jgi:putative peptidoglycan lipid II flippase
MTALSLQAFSLGLIGFSLVKVLAPAYFAREDTKTPVKVGLVSLAVNFGLSVILAYSLTRSGYEGTHAGLALATSVAAMVNAWLLYHGLRRDKVFTHGKGWSSLLWRFCGANVLMTLSLLWLNKPLDWWLQSSMAERSLWLALTIGVGGGVYLLALLALGLRPGALRLRSA